VLFGSLFLPAALRLVCNLLPGHDMDHLKYLGSVCCCVRAAARRLAPGCAAMLSRDSRGEHRGPAALPWRAVGAHRCCCQRPCPAAACPCAGAFPWTSSANGCPAMPPELPCLLGAHGVGALQAPGAASPGQPVRGGSGRPSQGCVPPQRAPAGAWRLPRHKAVPVSGFPRAAWPSLQLLLLSDWFFPSLNLL